MKILSTFQKMSRGSDSLYIAFTSLTYKPVKNRCKNLHKKLLSPICEKRWGKRQVEKEIPLEYAWSKQMYYIKILEL